MGLSSRGAPRVDVTIHELVLDGVGSGDPLVARAIERAVAEQLPAAGAADPSAIAAAVAAAVVAESTAAPERDGA